MTVNDVLKSLDEDVTILRNTTEAYEEVIGRIAGASTIEDVENILSYIEDVKNEIGESDYLRIKWLTEVNVLPYFIEKENA
jgi:hypothetical protein